MTKILKWAAIQIYYYLIAADGEICNQEMESFLEMAKETDPLFDQYKEELIEECRDQVNKIINKKNCYAVIKEGIDLVHRDQRKEILRGLDWKSGYIDPNVFIWNMLSIAISDGTYASEEREIIQYVVKKFEMDMAVLMELENAMEAIIEIDRSITWLSHKDKPFVIKGSNQNIKSSETVRVIEEFTSRREIILNSVKEIFGVRNKLIAPLLDEDIFEFFDL